MLFQNNNKFLEKLGDGKEIDCADIQNQSYKITKVSDKETLMNNGQKHPRTKDYNKYKTLGSNELFKSQIISRVGKASGKYSSWLNLRNLMMMQ